MNKNWILVKRISIPRRARILPCIWAMRRKRKTLDGTVYKWKARLNVDGGKQIHGIDYWETNALVATWTTIRIVLIMAEKWCIMQLDFIQAYPQAPVETELYIELPKGFQVDGDRSKYALKVLRNVWTKTSRQSMEPILGEGAVRTWVPTERTRHVPLLGKGMHYSHLHGQHNSYRTGCT
jgi:Reverse transcriptase (RNA-dependent DNA polymerase)